MKTTDTEKIKKLIEINEINVKNYIEYLINEQDGFLLFCTNIEQVKFEPELPKNLTKILDQDPVVSFAIQNYTLETAQIDVKNKNISFEAAFGMDDYVSYVTIPFNIVYRIATQISNEKVNVVIFENSILFNKRYQSIVNDIKQENNSLQMFLSNPENSKFFKKD